MTNFQENIPSSWTIDQLERLGSEKLHCLTQRVVGSLAVCRLLLGRCLLAIGRVNLAAQYACSGAIHYAIWSGVPSREAREARRVADCLEELPLLRKAAEEASISWASLREIVRKATPDTEERWLEIASRHGYQTVEKLVRRTRVGEVPQEPDEQRVSQPTEVELRLVLQVEVMALVERAVRGLAERAGRMLPLAEVIELVFAEHLAGYFPDPETLAHLREEARKDVAARQAGPALEVAINDSSAVADQASEVRPARVESPCPVADHQAANAEQVDNGEASACEEQPDDASITKKAEESCDEEPAPVKTPWAAVAALECECPGNASLTLVRPARPPHWQNDRLRFSPEARLVTRAQRREVLRRDGYCCSTPGCPHHLWLAVHHIVFYAHGGITVPTNLLTLCGSCHRNVHLGLLRVTGAAPGLLVWTDREGTSLSARPTPGKWLGLIDPG